MKSQRHNAIKDLLVKTTSANGGGAISNQDELRLRLAARGIYVTQATLSRDIRELKLVKGSEGYALSANGAAEDDGPATASVLENFGLEIVQAQNLLILHTTMGGAQPVAAALDSEPWEEIVGTIAGDNAVLIVCPDNAGAAALKTRIETYLA